MYCKIYLFIVPGNNFFLPIYRIYIYNLTYISCFISQKKISELEISICAFSNDKTKDQFREGSRGAHTGSRS